MVGTTLNFNQTVQNMTDFKSLSYFRLADIFGGDINKMKILNPHQTPSIILLLGLLFGCLNTHAATDCTAVTEISQIECESLLELYHSTDGENWGSNESWNVTNTLCSWYGITCENGGVTEINFVSHSGGHPPYSNNLNRTPPSLKSFPKLTGTIPDFSGLPHLQKLYLSSNQLTGEIPDFSALPNLQTLALIKNQLTGEIPDFSALPKLQELSLWDNQLTGKIPDFSDLLNLSELSIGGNQLTGTLCHVVTEISLIECESLLQLYHSTDGANWKTNDGWNTTNNPCNWYGITCENNSVVRIELSTEYKKNPPLFYVYVPNNNLVGTIPNFKGLPNLQRLSLFNNHLSGTIPDFSGLPNLKDLDLNNNQLTGPISDFSGLPNLQVLELQDNQLMGPIPNFSGLPNLKELDLSNNQFTGPIPNFRSQLNLQTLSLSSNQLTGDLPDFKEQSNLSVLNLEGNQLTDTLCKVVTEISQIECESLLQLYHSTNGSNWKTNTGWNSYLEPCDWYGVTCENNSVVAIDLSYEYKRFENYRPSTGFSMHYFNYVPDNNLVGTIPNFKGLPNLQTLSLADNHLTGAIPNFSGVPNLQELYLDGNQLTGPIPDFNGLPNLQELELDGNQLTGKIPNFSAMPNLQTLSLEGNQLTTVQVLLEKQSYHLGEYFKAKLIETFSEGYDLYAAVLLPNGTDFMALENTNQFVPLNQPQKFSFKSAK